jgi:hypothetical protein
MKKLIFTLLAGVALLTANVNSAKAQEYKHAIGGRFGSANGISFKTGLNKDAMLELIANFRSSDNFDYLRLTALYEKYNPINGAPGLNWFYGGGGTVGTVKFAGESDVYLGLNGVLGLDYKFKGAPINLSLDWIPTFQLTPDTDFYSGDIGLGVRFTF